MARMKQRPKAHANGKAKKPNPLLDDRAEDHGDELDSTPQEVSRRRDPDYQLHKRAMESNRRYQSTMANIFEKYSRDFGDVADEIDLRTGEIIVNRGHIEHMRDEGDVGTDGSEDDSDDEEDDVDFAPAGTPPDVSEDDEGDDEEEEEEDAQVAAINAKAREYAKALGKSKELRGWVVDGDEEEAQDGWEDTSGDDEGLSGEEAEEEESEEAEYEETVEAGGQRHTKETPQFPQPSQTGSASEMQPFPFMPFPFFPMGQHASLPPGFPPMPAPGSLPFTHGTDITHDPQGFGGQPPFPYSPFAYYMSQWAQASQQGFPSFNQKAKPKKKALRDMLAQKSGSKSRASGFKSIWTEDPPRRKRRTRKAVDTSQEEPKQEVDEVKPASRSKKVAAGGAETSLGDASAPQPRKRGRKPRPKNKEPEGSEAILKPQAELDLPEFQAESSLAERDPRQADERSAEPADYLRYDDAHLEDDSNRRRSGRQRKQTDFLGMICWYKESKSTMVVEMQGSSPSRHDDYRPHDVSQERGESLAVDGTGHREAQEATEEVSIPDSQDVSTPPVSSADQDFTPTKHLQPPIYHYSRADHGAALSDDSQPVSPAVARLSKPKTRPGEDGSLAIRVAEALSAISRIDEQRQPSPRAEQPSQQDEPDSDPSPDAVDYGQEDSGQSQDDDSALPDSGIDVSHEELVQEDKADIPSEEEGEEEEGDGSIPQEPEVEEEQVDASVDEAVDVTEHEVPGVGIDLSAIQEQESSAEEPPAMIPNSTDETASTASPAPKTQDTPKRKRGRPPKAKPITSPPREPTLPRPTSTSPPKKPTHLRNQLPTPSPTKNHPLPPQHSHSASKHGTPSSAKTVVAPPPPPPPSTPHRSKARPREPSSRRSLLSLLSDDEADDLSRDIPPTAAATFSPSSRVLATLQVTSAARRASSSSSSRRVWKKRGAVAGRGDVLLHTPTKKRKWHGGEAGADNGCGAYGAESGAGSPGLVETPGGSKRRCGAGGFMCGRDFCFSCVV
ncbi:hypothetical protein N3K66_005640 [Trichothecium roseum]|uniref:Uncharacterized protein n=1 Tax=Trichothecium roseum TaxID=47278 RepID=A0ACC0UZR4_9HYPO|nr:hypothetical protein N3K66_005640 [Trichothecium roseum]